MPADATFDNWMDLDGSITFGVSANRDLETLFYQVRMSLDKNGRKWFVADENLEDDLSADQKQQRSVVGKENNGVAKVDLRMAATPGASAGGAAARGALSASIGPGDAWQVCTGMGYTSYYYLVDAWQWYVDRGLTPPASTYSESWPSVASFRSLANTTASYEFITQQNWKMDAAFSANGGLVNAGFSAITEQSNSVFGSLTAPSNHIADLQVQMRWHAWEVICDTNGWGNWVHTWNYFYIPHGWAGGMKNFWGGYWWTCQAAYEAPMVSNQTIVVSAGKTTTYSASAAISYLSLSSKTTFGSTIGSQYKMTYKANPGQSPRICGSNNVPTQANYVREK